MNDRGKVTLKSMLGLSLAFLLFYCTSTTAFSQRAWRADAERWAAKSTYIEEGQLRDRQNLMILIAGPYRSGTDDVPKKVTATAPPASQTLRALSQHPAFSEENAHARLHNDH